MAELALRLRLRHFSQGMKTLAGFAAAGAIRGGLVSGSLVAIAFWIESLWFLGLVALAPLLFSLQYNRPLTAARAFGGGMALGVFYFLLWGFPLLSYEPNLALQGPAYTSVLRAGMVFMFVLAAILFAAGCSLALALTAAARNRWGAPMWLLLPAFWIS